MVYGMEMLNQHCSYLSTAF